MQGRALQHSPSDGAAMTAPARIFYSYSRRDEEAREELERALATLREEGLISEWVDRRIGAGADWGSEIEANLATADIVLLLVSSDFLASDYCKLETALA